MPSRRVSKALTKTQQRKKEHLEICLDTESVTNTSGTGLDHYRFVHNALPELDIDELDLSTSFLGKRLNAPILISSMTGGFDLARKVNRNLAAAAERLGIAMGVGSQRVAIEEPSAASSFQVRDVAPNILLLGNLGAVQLNYGYSVAHCRKAVEMIGADALILHLNVLQEAMQPEGNRNFKGLRRRPRKYAASWKCPWWRRRLATAFRRTRRSGCTAPGSRPSTSPARAARRGHRWKRSARLPKASMPTPPLPIGAFPPKKRWSLCDRRYLKCPGASGGIRTGLDVDKAIAWGRHGGLRPASSGGGFGVSRQGGRIYQWRVARAQGCYALRRRG